MDGGKIIRRVSLVTAVIEQYLFSGLVLGWASLVYIMKEENFFAELCDESIGPSGRAMQLNGTCSQSCAAQDSRFNVSKSFFYLFAHFYTNKRHLSDNNNLSCQSSCTNINYIVVVVMLPKFILCSILDFSSNQKFVS